MKEAIEVVPPLVQRVWVLQLVLHCSWERGCILFRSKLTEPLSHTSEVIYRVSHLIRGLVVTSCLEDAYTFPITGNSWDVLWGQSVSILGSSLWPCTLAPISSSEQMAVWHQGVVLAHLKELGLRLNIRKVCFSSTENHLSGHGVESDHDAGMYVPCSYRVNPHVSQESKRRPVTHCQAVSKTAGSDVSCVQRDTF